MVLNTTSHRSDNASPLCLVKNDKSKIRCEDPGPIGTITLPVLHMIGVWGSTCQLLELIWFGFDDDMTLVRDETHRSEPDGNISVWCSPVSSSL